MTTIPIVFCIDDHFILAAGVCISSLLTHTGEKTFYDIYILHDDKSQFPHSGFLEKLENRFDNFRLIYKCVEKEFEGAFEIRGITRTAYYRLLIPELIPEHDRIMYHDVDVIFRSDLAQIFSTVKLDDAYVAGVVSPGTLDPKVRTQRVKMGLVPEEYILSGDLIFNSKKIREDDLIACFRKEALNKYPYQDMDILNLVCKGKIKRLPPMFCGTTEIFNIASNNIPQNLYTGNELQDLLTKGIIHYNGQKPWIGGCPNMDIWWEYYRNSVFFDQQYYYDFFNSMLSELDRLSLWKRIKLIFRYFLVANDKSA